MKKVTWVFVNEIVMKINTHQHTNSYAKYHHQTGKKQGCLSLFETASASS